MLVKLIIFLSLSAAFELAKASSGYSRPPQILQNRQVTTDGKCSKEQPKVAAPHKNIWFGLTDDETASVIKYLHQNSSGLNLTAADNAGSWDNKIVLVELLQPNKTDVLPFLASNSTAPPRYARATLMFRATKQPYVQDYMVGPLPISNSTKIQALKFLYTNKEAGKIKLDSANDDGPISFNSAIMNSVADITKALWNVTRNDTLSLQSITPLWNENGRLINWSGFMNAPTSDFDTYTLLPLGLYVRSDVTGRDSSKWNVTGWYYNGKFYASTDEFRKAATSPGFEKLGPNVDGPWAQTDKIGDSLPFDELPPPLPVSQGPPRFSVDYKENYVSWMDFSFYLALSRDTGMRLFDVRYKGKRILYELGLQEAVTHYAGSDPVQSGTTYFDSLPGFGPAMVSLVNGFDCPAYSTYLNTTYHAEETSHTQTNGICLFEMDAGYPIQRHSTGQYTSVTRNTVFTVRSISTIGNYDFMTSYNFHLDGSMEVSVRASGYIQSAYFAHNEEYGFKIHDNLSGSLHDHVLNFKADFDIMGVKNSLQKVEIIPTTAEYPWSKGKTRNSMKISRSFIHNESEGKINWAPNGAAMYAIVNKDTPNTFGEYPGFRMTPSTGNMIHLTVQNSSNVVNAANYATHHFYVTKQKDTEAQSAHSYNQLDPTDPLIDFGKFFNNESLDQEDLVVWFNLGMHHVPHTGDLPNTMYTTAHSSMTIEPMNYLPGDPSRATKQQVRVNYSGDGKVNSVERFGSKLSNCSIDVTQLHPNLFDSSGDIAIRKYPYDPSQHNFGLGRGRG